MALIDRVHHRATHCAALHHTEPREGGERLLDRPQAELVPDQPVHLAPGQWSTRTQHDGEHRPDAPGIRPPNAASNLIRPAHQSNDCFTSHTMPCWPCGSGESNAAHHIVRTPGPRGAPAVAQRRVWQSTFVCSHGQAQSTDSVRSYRKSVRKDHPYGELEARPGPTFADLDDLGHQERQDLRWPS